MRRVFIDAFMIVGFVLLNSPRAGADDLTGLGLQHGKGIYEIIPELGVVAICGEDPFDEGYEPVFSVPGFPLEPFYSSLSRESSRADHHDGSEPFPERLLIRGARCFYEVRSDVKLGFGGRYLGFLPSPTETVLINGYEFPPAINVDDVSQMAPLLLKRCESGGMSMFDVPHPSRAEDMDRSCNSVVAYILRFRTYYLRLVNDRGTWVSIPISNGYFFHQGQFLDRW